LVAVSILGVLAAPKSRFATHALFIAQTVFTSMIAVFVLLVFIEFFQQYLNVQKYCSSSGDKD
jgi:hypothetical protein